MSEYWVPKIDLSRYYQNISQCISIDKHTGWLRYDYDENAAGLETLRKWAADYVTTATPGLYRARVADDDEGMSKEDLDESQKLLYEFLGVSESDYEK